MPYKGDGSSLSLMELDILRHTGCKWSRILYTGFRGYIRPQDKQDMTKLSADRNQEDLMGFQRSGAHLLTSPNQSESICDSFIRSFNQEYNKIVEHDGLRSASNQTVPGASAKKMNDDLKNLAFSSKTEAKNSQFNPFQNEVIQKEYNSQTSNVSGNSIV